MWRLVPILGAAANLMPEPVRLRWREDTIWGPLFTCLLDILRARGPAWRQAHNLSDVDSTPTKLPSLLRPIMTSHQDPVREILKWAESWVPEGVWIRTGTCFQSFHNLTPDQRRKAVIALANLAGGGPPVPAAAPAQPEPHPGPLETPSTTFTARHRHGTPAGYRGRPEVWRSKVADLHSLPLEEVLLRPFRPIRHIPRRCMPAVAGIVREVCFMTTSPDDNVKESGAILWALLPRMLFAAVIAEENDPNKQAHRGQAIRAEVEKRLAHFRAGEWKPLLPQDTPLKAPSSTVPDAPSRAKECVRYARAGLMARGMAALNAAPLAPADERTFDATRKTLQAADHTLSSVDLGIPLHPRCWTTRPASQ